MGQNIFLQLEEFRKKQGLSVLALCRELGTQNVNYYRWKKRKDVTGPYQKIIESYLLAHQQESAEPKSLSVKEHPKMRRQDSSDIAVIGMACFYPGARNINELWENILARRVQFRRILDQRLPLSDYYDENAKDEKSYLTQAAFIDGFEFNWSGWRIPKKVFESTDIVHWLALETARKALEDAGYQAGKNLPTETTGVLVGNTLTGEQARSQSLRLRWPFVRKALDKTLQGFDVPGEEREKFARAMEDIYKSAFYPVTEDSLAGGLANTIAGRICNYFKLNGGGYIVDGACSSSLLATATAVNALRSGEMDLALAGGVDISLDPFELVGFSKAGALAKDQMRVYDRRGAGFLPGEGCGFIVLKRLADAVRDNDRIYAVIKGCGISSDGKGGIMEPSSEGQARAILRAYRNAGYTPAQLDFVEGHGTGTTRGDAVELAGIALAIEKSGGTDVARACGVTSFKSVVGHTKAAAGIGGLLKAILAVNQRIVPPVANCEEPHQIFETDAQSIYPVIQGRIYDNDKVVRAGVSAAGFGGINCHITLQSYQGPAEALRPALDERAMLVSAQKTEVFVFSAKTVDHLKRVIEKFKEQMRFISRAEMADFACWLNLQSKKHTPVKAAIVTDTPEHLYEAFCAMETFFNENTLESGRRYVVKTPDQGAHIVIASGMKHCRIGFLYPGQASQKLNMTRHLFERYPWAREFAAHLSLPVDTVMYQPLDQLITDDERRQAVDALNRTEVTQPAVVLSSLIWSEFLSRLGIEPAAVGGHSLGELCAFYKAGAFSAGELLQFAQFRGKVMSNPAGASGVMMSVFCSLSEARALIEQVEGIIVIANINAPKQIILSGEEKAVREAERLAAGKKIRTVILPASNAFHSPLMHEASKKIEGFAGIARTFTPEKITLFSGMADKPVQGAVHVQEYFSRQCISGVHFVQMVQRMMKECDLLIEAGPGRVLSGLVKQIDADAVCLPVEAVPGDDRDLNIVLAEIFTRGGGIRFEQLYENRLIRPFIPVARKKFITNQCERPLKDFSKVRTSLAQRIGETDIADADFHISSDESADGPAVDIAPDAHSRVDQILVEQVCRLTGFEKESVSMNLRLLDDLNLDSIKAAELIAQVTDILGVPGEIDPSQHSNKTLAEIAGVLQGLVKRETSGGQDPESADFDVTRYADQGWVRNFVMDYIDAPFSKTFLPAAGMLKSAKIFCADDEPLRAALAERMTIVENDAECVISILPRPLRKHALEADDLKEVIAFFQGVIETALSVGVKPKAVVFVQFGGGFFGEGKTAVSAVSSCARALASTLHLEHPDLAVRVLDFDASLSSEVIASTVMGELEHQETFSTAGYDRHLTRRTGVLRLSDPSDYQKRTVSWSSRDVVLVTGGAKGITAECALEFARFSKARIILAGRSPVPAVSDMNNSVTATLKRFADEGLTAEYFSCDITDRSSVDDLIRVIRKKYGPVTGVIHGAGLNTLRKLKGSDAGAVFDECLPKVMGARNIFAALETDKVKLIGALTSVIGVTGMEGSGWYGLANELLNLELNNFKQAHPQVQTFAAAYSVWDETGMGVNLGAIDWLAKRGISAIPAAEGAKRFRNLAESCSGAQQTVVVARTAGLDTWKSARQDSVRERFIEDVRYELPGVELIARCRLNVRDDSYVLEHNWKGSLLFPLVFGLEAMAQGYARVTGGEIGSGWIFQDVRLDKPIPVDFDHGTVIEIRVVTLEKEKKNSPVTARVEISCSQTGFKVPHFSALVSTAARPARSAGMPAEIEKIKRKTIDLDMATEVYGPILFQGGAFQCIEKIHQLHFNEKTRKGQCVFTSQYHKSAPGFLKMHPAFGGRFLTGDPFFLDSLLQSMQLIVSQDACLPNYIDEVATFDGGKQQSSSLAMSSLQNVDSQLHIATVSAKQRDGFSFKVKNCSLKILEHFSEKISANNLSDLGKRAEWIINKKLLEIQRGGNFAVPMIRCLHDVRLKKASKAMRHQIELPLIQEAVNAFLTREGRLPVKGIRVSWLKSGKPVLDNPALKDVGISLSHDGDLLVCAAGFGDQGVDIETVVQRSKAEWRALLGNKKYGLLKDNVSSDVHIDHLGTAIWGASESLKKAAGQTRFDVNIRDRVGDAVVFECSHEQMAGVAVGIKLARDHSCVLFSLVQRSREASLNREKEEFGSNDAVLKQFGFHKDRLFGIDLDFSGPQGQAVFARRFPVTFKSNQALSKKVYFTNFFDWMGMIREDALFPINEKLIKYFEVQKCGMVTNGAKVEILGPLKCGDILEGRMWMGDRSGSKNEKFPLYYEWRKISSRGVCERVAFGEQVATWVKITGHGLVKIEEPPLFFLKYMELFTCKEKQKSLLENFVEQYKVLDRGLEIYAASKSVLLRNILGEKKVVTSLEDSNLIGNIYFSNYSKWLARLQDEFFSQIIPDYFIDPSGRREMLCLDCDINFLAEAMPFENIVVRMYFERLYKNGIDFYFEFHAFKNGGHARKLAFARQKIVFSQWGDEKCVEKSLPSPLLNYLKSNFKWINKK